MKLAHGHRRLDAETGVRRTLLGQVPFFIVAVTFFCFLAFCLFGILYGFERTVDASEEMHRSASAEWSHIALNSGLRAAEGTGVQENPNLRGYGSPAAELLPTPDSRLLAAQAARIKLIEKLTRCVVAIFSYSGSEGGSGVLISPDGLALTNFHVAKPCGLAMKCGLPDGKLYDAITVGWDPTGDIALIKLLGRTDFPYALLGDSDEVRVGDEVFVMGNPFMLAMDLQPTVTWGIISGTHRYQHPAGTILEYTDCLQTDASINPGNSGGPMFDCRGRLIGVNGRASFDRRGRVNVGVGYAVSINQVKNFLGHLKGGRIVDHATLGAQVNFDQEGRVVVSNIVEHCDAWRRGLRMDDELVSFAGRPIRSPNEFKNLLGIYPAGWRVPLSFRRQGTRFDILVRLEPLHSEAELLEKTERFFMDPPRPEMPIPQPGPQGVDAPNVQESENADPPEAPEGNTRERKSVDNRQEPAPGALLPQGTDAAAALPKVVRPYYEAKRGFANFYFNRLHQRGVWQPWRDSLGSWGEAAEWHFRGQTEGGVAFEMRVDDRSARLKLPQLEHIWESSRTETFHWQPPQPAGLLLCLYLWRQLAMNPPERFPGLYYWGVEPLWGEGPSADVLAAVFGPGECRWIFQGNMLAGMELGADPAKDPWEVRFLGEQRIGDGIFPAVIEVRWGDFIFERLKLEGVVEGSPSNP